MLRLSSGCKFTGMAYSRDREQLYQGKRWCGSNDPVGMMGSEIDTSEDM